MPQVSDIQKEFESELKKTSSLSELNKLSIKYLGRNGKVNQLLQSIKDLSVEQKKESGKKINELKNFIVRSLDIGKRELLKDESDKDHVDITLPGKQYPKGSLHMLTPAIEEISRIFEKIGFIRVSYPEVEWEYYAFEALNMPKGHPARDDFETFYFDVPEHKKYAKMVLSPHTSSGQVREMLRLNSKPPIRMINIAKCYRLNWDTTHTPMFHQFEGLCVDRGINITHLKGTIEYFAKEFFGQNREIRLRPHHFQFTEPSFEVDVTCGTCLGKGMVNELKCRVCKSGWMELAGCGMVHPNVLMAGGIDPDVYTGWAFGFGPERCTMMKEGLKLNDMRIMYGNDIRFLKQF
jgi:phenylalanyl-tRNA synthetase alpha chain